MAKKTKFSFGEVAEWLKAQHWKCCLGVTSTRVRIPPSPLNRVIQALQHNDLVRYLTRSFVFGIDAGSMISPTSLRSPRYKRLPQVAFF